MRIQIKESVIYTAEETRVHRAGRPESAWDWTERRVNHNSARLQV